MGADDGNDVIDHFLCTRVVLLRAVDVGLDGLGDDSLYLTLHSLHLTANVLLCLLLHCQPITSKGLLLLRH